MWPNTRKCRFLDALKILDFFTVHYYIFRTCTNFNIHIKCSLHNTRSQLTIHNAAHTSTERLDYKQWTAIFWKKIFFSVLGGKFSDRGYENHEIIERKFYIKKRKYAFFSEDVIGPYFSENVNGETLTSDVVHYGRM